MVISANGVGPMSCGEPALTPMIQRLIIGGGLVRDQQRAARAGPAA